MFKKTMLVTLGVVLLLAAVQSLTAQQRMGRGSRMGRGRGGFSYQQYRPVPINEEEKHILSILDDMNRNQSSGMMNVPTVDGRILRLLTEAINAKHVVEIGTSNGYSGTWFCLALRTTGGKLTTHEIDTRRASLARENFKRAGVDKLVTLVEGDAQGDWLWLHDLEYRIRNKMFYNGTGGDMDWTPAGGQGLSSAWKHLNTRVGYLGTPQGPGPILYHRIRWLNPSPVIPDIEMSEFVQNLESES